MAFGQGPLRSRIELLMETVCARTSWHDMANPSRSADDRKSTPCVYTRHGFLGFETVYIMSCTAQGVRSLMHGQALGSYSKTKEDLHTADCRCLTCISTATFSVLRFAECSSRPHSVALRRVSCSPPEDSRGFGPIGHGSLELSWFAQGPFS
jgi:hypothetical protein